MMISTRGLLVLALFFTLFSCARREQALFQPTHRERFTQVNPLTTPPIAIKPTVSDTNQTLTANEPVVLSASATTDKPVNHAKPAWESSAKPEPQKAKATADQVSRHQQKTQLRKSVLKKLLTEAPGQTSGLAIASLVCGILSLFILGVVLGPLAVIFGGVALSKISKNPEVKGRGLAVAGLIIGIVATILIIIYLASR